MSTEYHNRLRLCGCWIPFKHPNSYAPERKYLPQIDLRSATTILATTSRTTLKQTFVNDQNTKLDEVQYTFPLYDGVSVVGFTCSVGSKTIVGVVKERQQARVEYQEAVARGETAGLLEQLPEASDVFTTSVGNVPANEKVHIEITYLGELKHDAETDGSRFTIPTIIAPRYGMISNQSATTMSETADDRGGISICVDVTLDDGTIIRGLQSPSHPIAVTMGRTSSMSEDSFSNNHASAALTLGTTELDKDFVVVVHAKGTETPRALLETHSTISNQRAIMATLVPKFSIPNISPEIVFVIDRSGSMHGKIELVVSAMKIFLKSLPIGVKFNICSFGWRHTFLFPKSKTYDQSSLREALTHLNTFAADYGGTEMLEPVKATVQNRYKDLPLEVMLLTDGEIWNQEELFTFINETTNARFFTLGIGSGASSALVEGIARAGNGFAQFVGENEKMEKRVVRMLKGALTPHVSDYTLEINYGQDERSSTDDDFEMIDSVVAEKATPVVTQVEKAEPKKSISLFDTSASEEPTNPPAGRYDNLPHITTPQVLRAPFKIPALYPFNRTTVYLLLGPEAPRKTAKSVILRGTSDHGPLELDIPIQDVGLGETVHQLAAKKAVHELEQGRGWITEACDDKGKLFKKAHEGKWDLIVEREAVRLGVEFQVGGKWCSFVAVEKDSGTEHDTPTKSTQAKAQSNSPAVAYRRMSSRSHPSPAFGSSGTFGLFATPGKFTSPFSPSHSSQPSGLFGTVSPPSAANPPLRAGFAGRAGSGAVSSCFAAPSSNSVFGGLGQAQQAGGLFGSGAANRATTSPFAAPSSAGGGFGALAGPPQAGGLFGSSPNPPASSSLPEYYPGSLFSGPSICTPGGGLFSNTSTASSGSAESSKTIPPPPSSGFDSLPCTAPSASPALSSPPPLSHDLPQETPADFSFAHEGTSMRSRTTARTSTGGAAPRMQMASFGGAAPAPGSAAPTAMMAMQMPMMTQMQQQQMQAASTRAASAGPSPDDYQNGLMTLHQDNKLRKKMAPRMSAQAPAPPPPAVPYSSNRYVMQSPGVAISAAGRVAHASVRSMDVDTIDAAHRPSGGAIEKAKKSGGFNVLFRRQRRKEHHSVIDNGAHEDEDEAEVDESRTLSFGENVASLTDTEKMHKIIDLQEFDGSWRISDKLLQLVGVSYDLIAGLSLGNGAGTAVAIAWIKGKVASEEDVWEMVVEKALGWLASQLGGEGKADEAVAQAGKYF